MASFADLWEQTPSDKFGGMKSEFADRLKAANDAWQSQTGKPLPITSGARTTQEQTALYANRGSNPNLVAKPGTSRHESGQAADINPSVPDSFLQQFGLHRPLGAKDPVHVEAMSEPKQNNNFADLWESAPTTQTTQVTPQVETKPMSYMEKFAQRSANVKEQNAPLVQGLASLADTAYGVVPATVGGLTYAGGRALGQTPEQATATSQKVAGAIGQPFGKALGVTETAGYKNEAVKQAMDAIGQYVGESADAIAQKTGIPKSDVENMLGTLMVAVPELGGKIGAKLDAELKAREFTPEEMAQRKGGVTAEQMGRNVGASEASNKTFLKNAVQQASPELAAELKTIPLNDVNKEGVNRQLEADSLPVPIKLTLGQTTQDVNILSKEVNSRAKNPELAQHYNEQNQQLIDNINAINENAAPNVFGTNHVENGQALIDSYMDIDKARTANIDAKYQALKDAAGGDFPVDGVAFANNALDSLKKNLKTEFLPDSIMRQINAFKRGETMTFEQFEAMRTNLASEMRKADRAGDGNAEFALGKVREALEDLPLTKETDELKVLANNARSAAKERFDALDQDKAYKATVNGKVAADDFIQKFVVNGKKADIDTMVAHLGTDSQAREVMAAGIINWLKSKSGIVNETGNFSQSGFNKALQSIDPKILTIVGSDVNQQLKALGNTARLTQARPKGSYVNESNTFVNQAAEIAKSGIEKTANTLLGGGFFPVGTMAREALQKQAGKQTTKKSLKPGAGTRLSDIGK